MPTLWFGRFAILSLTTHVRIALQTRCRYKPRLQIGASGLNIIELDVKLLLLLKLNNMLLNRFFSLNHIQ